MTTMTRAIPGKNTLIPDIATVRNKIAETPNIVTLQVTFDDKNIMEKFAFEPGQVAQVSVFGYGESTFVINSSPLNKEYLEFSIMKAGVNTTAIHNLSQGEKIGIRAPLGRPFPYREMEGKNIFFIGGGIGLAPLRPLIFYILANKEKYARLTLLNAAKTPEDFCFEKDLKNWEDTGGLQLIQTIDNACYGWDKEVGLCPDVLEKINPSPVNSIAVVCGPPIMIKFTLAVLKKSGFNESSILTTLERRMKCGIGKCGRCNIGEKFVCTDGPVFSLKELNALCECFI